MDLADILIRQGACRPEHVAEVCERLGDPVSDRELGAALVAEGRVGEESLCRALAEQFGLRTAPALDGIAVPHELVMSIPIDFARRRLVLPLEERDGRVFVALADPLDDTALDDVAMLLGRAVEGVVAAPSALHQAINRFYYEAAGAAPDEDERDRDGEAAVGGAAKDLLQRTSEGPVVEVVDRILLRAVRAGASDVHLEPYEGEISMRFRIDGMLCEQIPPPAGMRAGIVSRIKVMADLDIAEQRLPQDGKARIRIGDREFDIRVSTVPTTFGERVVLRLLDPASMLYSLEALGMSREILGDVEDMLSMAHGLILVTGPTGSGKTTTLYAALQKIHDRQRNIITIEDPVEYQLRGIGQIEVRPRIGLTFAQGLRHVLRQDPDVILIGEMRDLETAQIAVRASLTGHKVLSTLHTNDGPAAVTRLVDIGVEPYLVAACLLGVLGQRLVRRLCPGCAVPEKVDPAMARALGVSEADIGSLNPRRGKGCESCGGTGYRGRLGLFEILRFDREVRRAVHDGRDEDALRAILRGKGYRSLREDGLAKVRSGLTTVDELVRVTMREQD